MPARRRVIPEFMALSAALIALAHPAAVAQTLIPPAPQPVPGGNSNAPVVAPTPIAPVQPAPVQPIVPPTTNPPTTCPPVNCPTGSVVVWYADEYPWGLGYWRGNLPWGYRLGNPNEPLGVTSRRLDPQALPPLPAVIVLTPQQEAQRLLSTNDFERAAGALGVLVTHARNAASGALAVPPGSAAPAQTPAPTTAPAPTAPTEIPWTLGETQRLLAVALLGQKLEAQAVRAAAEAYAAEPSLADHRLTSDIVGPTDTLRRLMLRAVTHAQKTNSPDSWLLAAMMMHAQGRTTLPDAVKRGLAKHPLATRLTAAPAPHSPGSPHKPAAPSTPTP